MHRLTRIVSLLALLAVAACSSSPDQPQLADGPDEELNAAKPILEAKLYDDPDATPSAGCDVHTAATLLQTKTGKLRLQLENRVSGGCEIFIVPNKRTYSVAQSDSCGSKVYKGTSGADSVELQDHSTRMCEDFRPALLELSEKRNGQQVRLYGKQSDVSNPPGTGDAQILDVKLYGEPNAEVSAFCDQYTHLGLKRSGDSIEARLENKLSATSSCEIFVSPNERLFTVSESEDCGSKVYTSESGGDRIVIKDHSTRLCENVVPARIEVELTVNNRTSRLYSPE
jgi:hypothetical protein